MIARRRMLETTLFGGFLGAAAPVSTEAADQSASEKQTQEIVDALKDIRKAIEAPQGGFPEIALVRQKQIDFLRASGKFPDFVDVGLDVWFAIHDWHIRHLQPLAFGRDANGRYTIAVMATQVVLRPDLVPSFVGVAY